MPLVSVIIPTTGRPLLARAVQSVLSQTMQDFEILIVGTGIPDDYASNPKIRVLLQSQLTLGGKSRQIATEAAAGTWIAYLDDDDEWAANKLERQLSYVDSGAHADFLFSVIRTVGENGSHQWPRQVQPVASSDFAQYLFGNVSLVPGQTFLAPSSMLMKTEIAQRVGWDVERPIHQDWDFYLRAQRLGCTFAIQNESLVTVYQEGAGRVSKSGKWKESFAYLRIASTDGRLTRHQAANISLTTTLQLALDANNRRGVLSLMVWASSRWASPTAWVQAFARVLGLRNVARRILRKVAR